MPLSTKRRGADELDVNAHKSARELAEPDKEKEDLARKLVMASPLPQRGMRLKYKNHGHNFWQRPGSKLPREAHQDQRKHDAVTKHRQSVTLDHYGANLSWGRALALSEPPHYVTGGRTRPHPSASVRPIRTRPRPSILRVPVAPPDLFAPHSHILVADSGSFN